jgi:hypothetical protein
MMRRSYYMSYFFLSVLLLACSSSGHEENTGGIHHTSAVAKIKTHTDTITYDITVEPYLTEMKRALAEINDTVRFWIPSRKEHIQSFPCSNCHSKSLADLQRDYKEGEKKAHWNIHMEHAPSNIMECKTCHSTSNLDDLHLLTGERVDFDQSFKTCSQCHSTQFKDWVGGSHGKRLGGWAPPKVMNSCVNCHNPHKPGFETRFPSRLNTVTPPKLQEK